MPRSHPLEVLRREPYGDSCQMLQRSYRLILQLSLENCKSGKPSRCLDGEGCHAALSNRSSGAVDSGGVGEDDTTGRTTKISWESSPRGTATSQLPVQGGQTAKAGQARGAVGVLRSSDEPAGRERSCKSRAIRRAFSGRGGRFCSLGLSRRIQFARRQCRLCAA